MYTYIFLLYLIKLYLINLLALYFIIYKLLIIFFSYSTWENFTPKHFRHSIIIRHRRIQQNVVKKKKHTVNGILQKASTTREDPQAKNRPWIVNDAQRKIYLPIKHVNFFHFPNKSRPDFYIKLFTRPIFPTCHDASRFAALTSACFVWRQINESRHYQSSFFMWCWRCPLGGSATLLVRRIARTVRRLYLQLYPCIKLPCDIFASIVRESVPGRLLPPSMSSALTSTG